MERNAGPPGGSVNVSSPLFSPSRAVNIDFPLGNSMTASSYAQASRIETDIAIRTVRPRSAGFDSDRSDDGTQKLQ